MPPVQSKLFASNDACFFEGKAPLWVVEVLKPSYWILPRASSMIEGNGGLDRERLKFVKKIFLIESAAEFVIMYQRLCSVSLCLLFCYQTSSLISIVGILPLDDCVVMLVISFPLSRLLGGYVMVCASLAAWIGIAFSVVCMPSNMVYLQQAESDLGITE